MKQALYEVLSNEPIAPAVYKLVLAGDTSPITAPGQFVNIKVPGFYLRRPISLCDWDDKALTVIYKVVGDGTKALSRIKTGEKLDLLIALGNGYDTAPSGDRPLLIGGGVGVPPLFGLCRKLIAENKTVNVILGFNTRAEIFLEDEFRALGANVAVTTADGSYGLKGFVDAAMAYAQYTYFYTCGPKPMLKAVDAAAKTGGQFSLEERMGCGTGACMGCTCKTKNGPKRVCTEGPVFLREEIEW